MAKIASWRKMWTTLVALPSYLLGKSDMVRIKTFTMVMPPLEDFYSFGYSPKTKELTQLDRLAECVNGFLGLCEFNLTATFDPSTVFLVLPKSCINEDLHYRAMLYTVASIISHHGSLTNAI